MLKLCFPYVYCMKFKATLVYHGDLTNYASSISHAMIILQTERGTLYVS